MADENTTASNPRFELAVLGAALTNDEAWDLISRSLTEKDFLTPAHAQMYDELGRSEDEGRWGDPALLAQALVDGGREDGYEIVADATTSAAPMGTLQHYIDDLRGRSRLRQTAALSASFTRSLQGTAAGDLAGALALHSEELQDLSLDVSEEPWESAGSLVSKVEQGDMRMTASLPTGFPDIDGILQGGFRPKQMVTVAGRPSMGKSTIVIDFARHASFHRDLPGLHVTLEMSAEEVGARIASAEAAVPLKHILNDDLNDTDRAKVANLSERLDDAPLYVHDAADDPSWGAIRSTIVSAHRRYELTYVVIDYLQLMTFDPGQGRRVNSRQEEIGQISRGVKRLAKQLGITILAVAQLNRGPEQRTGNLPQMSDLREAGDLEQDSDVVGLVFRPDYYAEGEFSDRSGEADFIIAKQRNGPTGTANLAFQGHYSRFMSLAHESSEAPYPYPEA